MGRLRGNNDPGNRAEWAAEIDEARLVKIMWVTLELL